MLNALIVSAIIAFGLTMSNLVNKPLQLEYELTTDNSWNTLTLLSVSSSIFFGFVSYLFMHMADYNSDAQFFTGLGAIIGYIAMQAIYTDFSILKVDRWVLRLGYITVIAISIAYTITQYVSTMRWSTVFSLLLIYAALFALFVLSGVGASDIRAITIILPFLFIVNNVVGLAAFVIVNLYVSVIVGFWQHKYGKQPVPILPYMLVPYMIIVPCYGFILNAYQSYTLL